MNLKMILFIIGQIMKVTGISMIFPMIIGLYYKESHTLLAFGIPIVILLLIGFGFTFKKPKNNSIYGKEGFVSVSIAWILLSVIGALPFFISGDIKSFTDCIFETVSGFTTTGATVLNNVEGLSLSCHFWRCFTHWLGGMGVLVLVLAIMSSNNARTMYVMRAECPGPKVGRLVSKSKDSARILYVIYIALTLIEIIMLKFGGMGWYDSIIASFSTAGTGGFFRYSSSIAHYGSAYIEIVIAVFMFLFGINFNLYYYILLKKFSNVFKDEEFRAYIGIVAISTIAIAINIYNLYQNVGSALKDSFFQVTSIISTTGYATADYTDWPIFSQCIVVLLMFFGGCAGSTSGGIKISRILIMIKAGIRELKYVSNPRAVVSIKINGKTVEDSIVRSTMSYFILFAVIMAGSIMLVALDGFSLEETTVSVITCLNNVGPSVGRFGPSGSFNDFSNFSKYILCADMLLGRLEIFPLIMLFTSRKR